MPSFYSRLTRIIMIFSRQLNSIIAIIATIVIMLSSTIIKFVVIITIERFG